jgi:hypothetical protein
MIALLDTPNTQIQDHSLSWLGREPLLDTPNTQIQDHSYHSEMRQS